MMRMPKKWQLNKYDISKSREHPATGIIASGTLLVAKGTSLRNLCGSIIRGRIISNKVGGKRGKSGMLTQFSRTELLLGTEAIERLQKARVAVFGIGGVGGYVCEALVRSCGGAFDLIDNDTVWLSNLNRQIIATHSSVG